MVSVVGRRLLALVPVLLGISLLVFALTAISLGDPVRATMGQRGDPAAIARIRGDYGLDEPIWVQYGMWMSRLLRGDLGHSYRQQRPVTTIVAERFPATLRLALAATGVAVVLGVAAGTIAAVRHGGATDLAVMVGALVGISTPVFWLGLMLILVFAVWLGWFPVSGYGDGSWRHLVLPASILGYFSLAYISRMTRSFMLEQLRQEYIVTARVKGVTEWRVIWVHALGNVWVPLVTVIALSYAGLLEGSVLTETVFAWPGLGFYLTQSLLNADMNAVLGATLVVGAIFIGVNLLSDLLYRLLDPRAR